MWKKCLLWILRVLRLIDILIWIMNQFDES